MTALDPFFESYYRLRPVNATFTGVHEHDDRLPDWSPDGLAAAAGEMRSLRASLGTLRPMRPLCATSPRGIARSRSRFSTCRSPRSTACIFSVAIRRSRSAKRCSASSRSSRVRSHRRRSAPARSRRVSMRFPDFSRAPDDRSSDGVPDQWRAKCLHECDGAARLLRDGVARWLATRVARRRRRSSRLRDGVRRRRRVPPLADPRRAGGPAGSAVGGSGILRSAPEPRSPLRTERRVSRARRRRRPGRRARRARPSRALGGTRRLSEVQARLAEAHPTSPTTSRPTSRSGTTARLRRTARTSSPGRRLRSATCRFLLRPATPRRFSTICSIDRRRRSTACRCTTTS